MIQTLKKFNWTKNMFLVPIVLVAVISISHVVSWYSLSNPINWAIYLSIAIEVGAMTSLIAATKKIRGGVWFMFGLVTFIQMIGNIFYSYVQIDETGELFRNWVELTTPLFELMGTESSEIISHKRWLALLEGGLLPLISLTALHFYTKYDDSNDTDVVVDEDVTPNNPNDDTEDEHQHDMVMNSIVDDINEKWDTIEDLLNKPLDEYEDEIEQTITQKTQEKFYPHVIDEDIRSRKIIKKEDGHTNIVFPKRDK